MEKAVKQSEVMLKRGVQAKEQKAIMKDVSAKLGAGKKVSIIPTAGPTKEVEERIKSEVQDKGIFVMDEEDFNGLVLTDEPLSENERRQFLETFSSNVAYNRAGYPVSAPAAPPPARVAGEMFEEEGVKFSGEPAKDAFDLLMKIKGKGVKIANLSISTNNRISAGDITAVGATLNAFASGYYAVLDKAQKDTLVEMKPPDVSELGTIQLPQFLVGNTAVMPNEERVSLSRSEETDNVFVVGDKEARLNPNQFLLITNKKGTNILGVSQIVDFGEALPEIRIIGKGFIFDVPRVGKAHLFEKLLLQPGEKPQVLIEYEGKGESI